MITIVITTIKTTVIQSPLRGRSVDGGALIARTRAGAGNWQ